MRFKTSTVKEITEEIRKLREQLPPTRITVQIPRRGSYVVGEFEDDYTKFYLQSGTIHSQEGLLAIVEQLVLAAEVLPSRGEESEY